ncbi:MAG: helix-turn-helix domain-containing protein [Firmicutes bacterium]|nr:helix-turn-helix domain-containing protein [Bacillota bacterium]
MPDYDPAELGQRLRLCREAQGLSQRELAQRIHANQGTLSRWESGLRMPGGRSLLALARALGVTVDMLVGREPLVLPQPGGPPPEEAASDPGGEGGPAAREDGAPAPSPEPSPPPPTGGVDWQAIGRQLVAARQRQGWSLADLAVAVGAPPAAWAEAEAGLGPVPVDWLARAAHLLNLSLGDLLGAARPEEAAPPPAPRPVRTIPILGRIVAGVPLETQPDRLGTLAVPEDQPGDFALQVRGDSMLGAGIHPGDVVVVRRVEVWEQVPPGSCVVALVDGETTLKYLVREADLWDRPRWLLRAAHPDYPDRPLDPAQDRVQGIVVAVHTVRPPRPLAQANWPFPAEPSAEEAAPEAEDVVDLRGLSPAQREAVRQYIARLRHPSRRKRAPPSDDLPPSDGEPPF